MTDGLLLVSLDFYSRNLVYSTPNFLDKRQFIYFITLFFSIRWLLCTWQLKLAVSGYWVSLLNKELISTFKMMKG